MSLLGSEEPKESPINYLERPEFLGDAVLGFVCSVSLFFLFPNLGEGALSMLRCALGFQGFSISWKEKFTFLLVKVFRNLDLFNNLIF